MDLLLLDEMPKWSDLTRYAWNGCSHKNRAHIWRLLLRYEPLNYLSRQSVLEYKREWYRRQARVLYAPLRGVKYDLSSPTLAAQVDDASVYNVKISRPHGDADFMSNEPCDESETEESEEQFSSQFKQTIPYSSFSASALRQIEMDLPRTHPNLPIFHVSQVRGPMRRILYLFAMINPNTNYVQGMNEILSAVLAVFLTERMMEGGGTKSGETHSDRSDMDSFPAEGKRLEDVTDNDLDSGNPISSFLKRREFCNVLTDKQLVDAEADAYWVFSELVSRVGDNFCGDQQGIVRRVKQLQKLVEVVDPSLSAHLARNGNEFVLFAFRWFNCLLMRELPIHLVIKYWDALLAHPRGITNFHVYFCAALITRFSVDLMRHDFEDCMVLLQDMPTRMWTEEDIDELLSQACLWEQSIGIGAIDSD